MHTDPSNILFQLALRFVNQTEQHLFITGRAGTGKTTFLKYVREHCFKRMIVVAPTGVAAINARGVTIHSFFQLPFGPFLPSRGLENIRFTSEKRKLLEEIELVIIDEVSMMRSDTLDAIDQILRYFRKKPHLPFGGVQMVYIGDLHQLPPVVRNDEWDMLKAHYASPFFFDARAIAQQQPLYIELKKIYRQSDPVFIDLLNNVRNNRVDSQDMELLARHYQPSFTPSAEDKFITLTSHNARADEINRRELEKLGGKTVSYTGAISGEFNEKALPTDMNLSLKEGAQVLFVKNDKGDKRRYYNGKIATISRLAEDKIWVRFPDDEHETEIEKETWTSIAYRLDEESHQLEEEETGSFKQFPVRLAWAITIHKSQGLTFDRAIVDAGASFAPGQVYVALSRLRSLDGLILLSPIRSDNVINDPRIMSFIDTELSKERLAEILQAGQILYTNRMLVQSFEWSKMLSGMREFIQAHDKRKIPEKEQALQWAQEIYSMVRGHSDIARKFSAQLKALLVSDATNNYSHLQLRIRSAEKYFDEQLRQLEALVHAHKEKYAVHKKVKKYKKELNALISLFQRKGKELKNAVEMADNLSALDATTAHETLDKKVGD